MRTKDELDQLELINDWLVKKFNLEEGEVEEMEKILGRKGLDNKLAVLEFTQYGKEYKFYTVGMFVRDNQRIEAEKTYIMNWVSNHIDYSELVGFQRI